LRIRIRKDPKLLTGSGSEINISDPDSNPDSNPDPKPDPKPYPKPDLKRSSKKESDFQAKKMLFQTIMEYFNIVKE
jgi:hypothetical protein